MTQKITFLQLVASLCDATSCDNETASGFIKELFENIASSLSKGETVTVKGLGTFSLNGSNAVSWIPDEQLAAAVNEPFALFEAVELGDGVTEEILSESTPITMIDEAEENNSKAIDASEISEEKQDESPTEMPPVQITGDSIEADSETEHEPHTAVEAESEPTVSTFIATDNTEYQNNSQVCDEPEPYTRKRFHLHPCMTFLFGLILGLAGGYFGAIYAYDHISKTADSNDTAEMSREIGYTPSEEDNTTDECVSAEETSQADTIIASGSNESMEASSTPYLAIDTVTPYKYLTTMSRRYYGDYRFWVYIYEENKDQISDPDRINPGTAVIIPHAEKYGIDPKDKKSIADAERKSAEIQAQKSK